MQTRYEHNLGGDVVDDDDGTLRHALLRVPDRGRPASRGHKPGGRAGKGWVELLSDLSDRRALLEGLTDGKCRISKARLRKLIIELDVDEDTC